ncbi:S-layer homology domain-containing protein, partial [Lysinibacillus sp. NPDC096418]|uniref:S-layer homology domain-containing protein n=1 Tax=Lysinibacillus sp. NPDC096418 TaxID=3364138 RepID=UPI003807CA30
GNNGDNGNTGGNTGNNGDNGNTGGNTGNNGDNGNTGGNTGNNGDNSNIGGNTGNNGDNSNIGGNTGNNGDNGNTGGNTGNNGDNGNTGGTTSNENVLLDTDIQIIPSGTVAVDVSVTDQGTIIIQSNNISNLAAVTITIPSDKVKGILKIKTAKGLETVPYTIKDGKIIAQLHKIGELVFVESIVNFTDTANNQFNKYITLLAERGIIQGSNGAYNPNAGTTRAQFATMVTRALGLNEIEGNKFNDTSDEWFEGAANALAELDLVTGDNGSFKGNEKITRQQAFTIIGRLLEKKGYKTDANASKLKDFKDSDEVADYAKPYIDLLVSIGAINGSNGNLNPTQEITRGQMAKVLTIVLSELEML